MNNELMTLKEVADFLKVKPATIRYWIEKGIIRSFIKLNGQNNYRFRREDVEKMLVSENKQN